MVELIILADLSIAIIRVLADNKMVDQRNKFHLFGAYNAFDDIVVVVVLEVDQMLVGTDEGSIA